MNSMRRKFAALAFATAFAGLAGFGETSAPRADTEAAPLKNEILWDR
jgi:hypothetical protein